MCTIDEKDAMIPIDEAAEELATTGLRLLMLIREGKLEGCEEGGAWQVSRNSLERLRGEGVAPPVQQKGCASTCTSSKSGCGCR
ncbi:MAG: hypothetical protein HYV06_09310 [Deltaproteobacteria bacterium]|nr:hypothetical protein [Deltaproteobacteria bacterium]